MIRLVLRVPLTQSARGVEVGRLGDLCDGGHARRDDPPLAPAHGQALDVGLPHALDLGRAGQPQLATGEEGVVGGESRTKR